MPDDPAGKRPTWDASGGTAGFVWSKLPAVPCPLDSFHRLLWINNEHDKVQCREHGKLFAYGPSGVGAELP